MYIRDDEPLTQLNAERVESIPGLDDENKNNRILLAQHKLTHVELQEIECLKYLDSKFDLIANLLLCAESHCAFFIKPSLPKWTKVPATLQELLKSFPPKLESVYKAFDKSHTEYTEISARRNELWRHALRKMNTAILEELGHHGNNHKSQSSDDDYQSPLVSAAKDYSKIVRAFVDTIMKSVGSLSTEISAIILEWKQAECGLEQGEYPNYSKSEVLYLKGIMLELWNQAVSGKDIEKRLALFNRIENDCSGDDEDTNVTEAILSNVMVDAGDYERFQQVHGKNISRQWQEFGNNPCRGISSSDNEERGLRWKRGREGESHHFGGEGDTTEQSRKRARGWGRDRE
jgi:hypothetical protein